MSKQKFIAVRVPNAFYVKVKQAATKEERSVSVFIRRMLEKTLKIKC